MLFDKGESGLGKSTFINSFFKKEVIKGSNGIRDRTLSTTVHQGYYLLL